MPGPWTAAEAGSDAVSKKMLLTFLQENADAAFLEKHKLAGQVSPAGHATEPAMMLTVSLPHHRLLQRPFLR